MTAFQVLISAALAASALSYELNGSPTLPPINWEYQVESFVTYLVCIQRLTFWHNYNIRYFTRRLLSKKDIHLTERT
jgi:hypothetical protein